MSVVDAAEKLLRNHQFQAPVTLKPNANNFGLLQELLAVKDEIEVTVQGATEPAQVKSMYISGLQGVVETDGEILSLCDMDAKGLLFSVENSSAVQLGHLCYNIIN